MLDFIGLGAQKSGTTLLYEHLKTVDEICLSKQKEIHFFDTDTQRDYTSYDKYFLHCDETKMKGEITPVYIYFDDIPQKIYDYAQQHGGGE